MREKPRGETVGDFNGSDLLWRNNNGVVALWQMNGATVTNNNLVASLDSTWNIAASVIQIMFNTNRSIYW